MIQIDVIEKLLKRLKNKGWKQNVGYAIRGNPRVLERNGRRVAAVKPIKIDPFKILQNEIDNFFRSLVDILNKNGIKNKRNNTAKLFHKNAKNSNITNNGIPNN